MATWSKLRTGAWGVRGTGEAPAAGSTVVATRRNGATANVTIDAVVWSDGRAWLASIRSAPRQTRGGPKTRTGWAGNGWTGGICEDAPCCGCCGGSEMYFGGE